jgi:hypothetical protein
LEVILSDLKSIIYASSARKLFSADELIELLRKSRENNNALDITGMLLYRDGNFIQVLEGPEDVVMSLYEKIRRDKRHFGIIILGQQPITERQFPNWSMGFLNIDEMSAKELEGYNHFLKDEFSPEFFSENPIRAYIMLESFKMGM